LRNIREIYSKLYTLPKTLYLNSSMFRNLNDKIILKGRQYSYETIYNLIEQVLPQDADMKYYSYVRLGAAISRRIENEEDSWKKEHFIKIQDILSAGQRAHEYYLIHEVQEVTLWFSEQGREIKWYFKWIPDNGYNLIVSNIHGAYEYGTYETALILLSELKKTDNVGWFIIPTLNPDGLQEYFERGYELSAYLDGRDNAHEIDLNRNFCTQNFRLAEIEKYGKQMFTGREICNSEKETRVMVAALERFQFLRGVSLHSTGWVIYIPDNSIDDERVINYAVQLRNILPWYDFYPNLSTPERREESIYGYEIDEWNSWEFTGTMETYIYETYDIPVLLLELDQHWKIEENLKNIFSLDK